MLSVKKLQLVSLFLVLVGLLSLILFSSSCFHVSILSEPSLKTSNSNKYIINFTIIFKLYHIPILILNKVKCSCRNMTYLKNSAYCVNSKSMSTFASVRHTSHAIQVCKLVFNLCRNDNKKFNVPAIVASNKDKVNGFLFFFFGANWTLLAGGCSTYSIGEKR